MSCPNCGYCGPGSGSGLRLNAPASAERAQEPVLWGPEKQDYPGGPVYRIGSSVGASVPQTGCAGDVRNAPTSSERRTEEATIHADALLAVESFCDDTHLSHLRDRLSALVENIMNRAFAVSANGRRLFIVCLRRPKDQRQVVLGVYTTDAEDAKRIALGRYMGTWTAELVKVKESSAVFRLHDDAWLVEPETGGEADSRAP